MNCWTKNILKIQNSDGAEPLGCLLQHNRDAGLNSGGGLMIAAAKEYHWSAY